AIAAVRYMLELLAHDVITPGDLILVFGYFFGIVGPAVDLGALWPRIQGSVVGLHRVFHVLENLPTELDDTARPALDPVRERIAFDRVSFGFDGTPVLSDVTFEARRGTVTAVVGPAGAGKTTPGSLVPPLHAPDAGRGRAAGAHPATPPLAPGPP